MTGKAGRSICIPAGPNADVAANNTINCFDKESIFDKITIQLAGYLLRVALRRDAEAIGSAIQKCVSTLTQITVCLRAEDDA